MTIPVSEYNQRVIAWVNQHWPPRNPCPMCHTASGWDLALPSEIPMRISDVEGAISGRAIAVVPLTCNNCAYVVCLNAVVMGILDPAQSVPAPESGQ